MTADNNAAAAVAVAGQGEEAQKRLAAEMSSLEIAQEKKQAEAVPPHRSHDPQYNQKRSDPFQFGSRYLTEDDDVFEFNAWDHVETDDAYKEYAEQQYAMQRESPVSEFDKCEWNAASFFCSYFFFSLFCLRCCSPSITRGTWRS